MNRTSVRQQLRNTPRNTPFRREVYISRGGECPNNGAICIPSPTRRTPSSSQKPSLIAITKRHKNSPFFTAHYSDGSRRVEKETYYGID
jgi:hypothetical protein